MPVVSDLAICVRKVEYSETSQILSLFSREHGLVRVIAKGAHRRTKAGSSKFDGGIDLADLGSAVFSLSTERELSALTDWKLLDGHLSLRSSLRALYLAQYALELIAALFQEHDPHPAVFDRLRQLLNVLPGESREEAFLHFELELLREAGFAIDFSQCASCGRSVLNETAAFFSSDSQGVICRQCEGVAPDRVAIAPPLVRLLDSMTSSKASRLPRLTRHQTDPLNRLIASHVAQTLHRELRLKKWIVS